MRLKVLVLACTQICACQCPGYFVEWNEAVDLIEAGKVQTIAQAHSLDVTLELKDGCTLKTVEPVIDESARVLGECGAPCDDTGFVTE